ncbi:MAG TPA: TIGR00153 family protein [Kiritimatiellia bacterium]|nr:TIGR00153 family protein [Kiritimatiellia bacterium]
MQSLGKLFGESPFLQLVEHAKRVHKCVALVLPVAEAVVAGDQQRVRDLQHEMSLNEYEADQLKDHIRQHLPHRYLLPVDRDDIIAFLRQLDRISDDAEDFAVVATFRRIDLPPEIQPDFLAFVSKVVQVSESLLDLAEHVGQIQKEAFSGHLSEETLKKIQQISQMEWEADKLSRNLARKYYSAEGLNAVSIILIEKLCRALSSIADHAENVAKNLRLMITRR